MWGCAVLPELVSCGSCCPILLFIVREVTPTHMQYFPGSKRAGLVFAAAFPGQGPFSALLNTCKTQPRYLTGGGHVCALALCHYFALLHAREPCPCQALPSQPQLGTKVQDGITGWGVQVTPLYSASVGQVDTSPLAGWDGRCLKRKGTSVATCQGPHPSLTSGPVQWAWGFS